MSCEYIKSGYPVRICDFLIFFITAALQNIPTVDLNDQLKSKHIIDLRLKLSTMLRNVASL